MCLLTNPFNLSFSEKSIPLSFRGGEERYAFIRAIGNKRIGTPQPFNSVKGPIHPKGPHKPQVKLCSLTVLKKTARKTELNVLWHSTGFPSDLLVFFVSSV